MFEQSDLLNLKNELVTKGQEHRNMLAVPTSLASVCGTSDAFAIWSKSIDSDLVFMANCIHHSMGTMPTAAADGPAEMTVGLDVPVLHFCLLRRPHEDRTVSMWIGSVYFLEMHKAWRERDGAVRFKSSGLSEKSWYVPTYSEALQTHLTDWVSRAQDPDSWTAKQLGWMTDPTSTDRPSDDVAHSQLISAWQVVQT